MEYPTVRTKAGRLIKHEGFVASLVWNYVICDGDRVIGRAIVLKREDYTPVIDEDEDIFMDICIYDEADRKRGAGLELMNFVTGVGNHKALVSSSLGKPGFEFALKSGWKLKPGMHKKTPDIFYFKKEK